MLNLIQNLLYLFRPRAQSRGFNTQTILRTVLDNIDIPEIKMKPELDRVEKKRRETKWYVDVRYTQPNQSSRYFNSLNYRLGDSSLTHANGLPLTESDITMMRFKQKAPQKFPLKTYFISKRTTKTPSSSGSQQPPNLA